MLRKTGKLLYKCKVVQQFSYTGTVVMYTVRGILIAFPTAMQTVTLTHSLTPSVWILIGILV